MMEIGLLLVAAVIIAAWEMTRTHKAPVEKKLPWWHAPRGPQSNDERLFRYYQRLNDFMRAHGAM